MVAFDWFFLISGEKVSEELLINARWDAETCSLWLLRMGVLMAGSSELRAVGVFPFDLSINAIL